MTWCQDAARADAPARAITRRTTTRRQLWTTTRADGDSHRAANRPQALSRSGSMRRRSSPGAVSGQGLLALPGVVPYRPIDFLVKRRTPRGELAELVVLRPHQGRAVTERPAHPLAVQP